MLRGGDPRQTDGWLRADAQAELDALPDEIALQFTVLREARNFLTHNSEESRVKLEGAVDRLAAADPRFQLRQSLTRRVLIDWLRAMDARRIRLLAACVPALWRAMVVVETVLQGPLAATTDQPGAFTQMDTALGTRRRRGKQPKLTSDQQSRLVQLYQAGEHTPAELAKLFAISIPTVSRVLKRARNARIVTRNN
jgi:DNA-binding CsgD family transcriptional regulator